MFLDRENYYEATDVKWGVVETKFNLKYLVDIASLAVGTLVAYATKALNWYVSFGLGSLTDLICNTLESDFDGQFKAKITFVEVPIDRGYETLITYEVY